MYETWKSEHEKTVVSDGFTFILLKSRDQLFGTDE